MNPPPAPRTSDGFAGLRQLALLDLLVDEVYRNAEERALARVPDAQGLGGSTRVPQQD